MQDTKIKLDALTELKETIGVIRHEIEQEMSMFGVKFQGLCEEGLSVQVASNFGEYWQENRNLLETIVGSIDERGLPYINGKIVKMDEVLRKQTSV